MSKNAENGLPDGKVAKADGLAKAPLTRQSWQLMQAFAGEYIKAGMAQKGETEGSLILKIQTGREIGLPPTAALRHLYVVNNKVALEGEAMLALILADPRCEELDYGWDEEKQRGYCRMVRSQPRIDHTAYFSVADAEAAGLKGKAGPWQEHRPTMCLWRAVSRNSRFVWADVILGVYLPEELGAVVEVVDDETHEVKVVDVMVEDTESEEVSPEPKEGTIVPEEGAGEYGEIKKQLHEIGEQLGYSKQKIDADIRATDGSLEQLGLLVDEDYRRRLIDKQAEEAEAEGTESGEIGPLFEGGEGI